MAVSELTLSKTRKYPFILDFVLLLLFVTVRLISNSQNSIPTAVADLTRPNPFSSNPSNSFNKNRSGIANTTTATRGSPRSGADDDQVVAVVEWHLCTGPGAADDIPFLDSYEMIFV